jgi:RNA polymerase sigma-70 factor (ECF subfamily)
MPLTKHVREEAADETLMERYADGDSAAFEELLGRFEGRAYAFFLRRTSSPQRAEDLYQELFLRIHRARGVYDPARAFAPWFFQIAHRLLVDDLRRAHRAHEVPLGDHEPRSRGLGSERRVADREQLAHLLEALSPDERRVLVAAKLEGIGYPALARELGRSVDAVKKMASRALQRLRATALAEGLGAI